MKPGILSGGRLVVAIAVVVLAGGSIAFALYGAGGEPNTASPSATAKTFDTAADWKRIDPGGDCHCADGSKFPFWDRRADPTKVVLFLDGDGVCWDTTSCAFTSTDSEGENDSYGWNLQDDEEPVPSVGIFNPARADNPIAGYSVLFVGSCTGDAYLGNASKKYSSKLTVEHRGYVNGTAALDYLAQHYPKATQVVVIGKTAGSVAAPIYGGLVADRLPNAKVTVFGAQSGAWPDNRDFNTKILDATWGAYHAMPDWAVKGLTVRDWGVPKLWIQAGRHNPSLVLARFDYAFDPAAAKEVTKWMDGNPPNLLAVTDANEAAIEAAGVNLHSYTAPGKKHGLFEFDTFYTIKVNDVRLVDWLKALITGKPMDDVHCDKCDQ